MVFEKIVDSLVEQDYAVVDDFMSQEELVRLRQELYLHFEQGEFKEAGIGKGLQYKRHDGIRGDFIRWMDRKSLSKDCYFIIDRLEALAQYLNETCYLGIRRHEIHFALYPAGSFYKRHLDVFQDTQFRKISVVCYLNEDWQPEQGGQIRLYLSDENGNETVKDVMPLGGRMVCFKSNVLEHEVLPATRERLSITGWLRNDDLVL